MKKLIFVFISFFIFNTLNAQFAIGLKTMFLYGENDFKEDGELIKRGLYDGGIKWEFFIESRVIDNFYVELGAMKKDYNLGFLSNREVDFGSGVYVYQSLSSFQIPLLAKYKYGIYKKLYIVPKLGTVFGFSQKQLKNPRVIDEGNTIVVNIDLNNDYFKKHFSLLQAGIDFELKFKHSSIMAGFDYIKGFSTLMNAKLRYSFKDSEEWVNATLSGDGGYVLYSLAYKYNF